MAPEERLQNSPLIESLKKEFYEYSFFKAVHLLEQLLPQVMESGRTTSKGRECVRFTAKQGLVFPPSDISGFHCDDGGRAELEVAFLGLIGPSGVLPHWYTELAQERTREKDRSMTAFFDLFHHRLISLFYLAWKKHRFPENYRPGGKDRLSGYLLSLIGLGTPGLTERIGLHEESLIYYSGLLSRQVPSAVAIGAAVEYFSETEVRVEQHIERMMPLSPEDMTRLGAANSTLGADAVCGSYARECQTKFRVDLGPMNYGKFVRLLPSGKALRSVFSLVRYMVGTEFEFDIGLILKREEVPPCVIGEMTPSSPRLGWSTWVKSPGVLHERDPQVVFHRA